MVRVPHRPLLPSPPTPSAGATQAGAGGGALHHEACTLNPTPYIRTLTHYALHPNPHTLHPTPEPSHTTTYAQALTHYTLQPNPHTLRTTPEPSHTTPYTRTLTHCTLHPNPHTLRTTPEPSHTTPCTRTLTHGACGMCRCGTGGGGERRLPRGISRSRRRQSP